MPRRAPEHRRPPSPPHPAPADDLAVLRTRWKWAAFSQFITTFSPLLHAPDVTVTVSLRFPTRPSSTSPLYPPGHRERSRPWLEQRYSTRHAKALVHSLVRQKDNVRSCHPLHRSSTLPLSTKARELAIRSPKTVYETKSAFKSPWFRATQRSSSVAGGDSRRPRHKTSVSLPLSLHVAFFMLPDRSHQKLL
jgi:hypothetical protein